MKERIKGLIWGVVGIILFVSIGPYGIGFVMMGFAAIGLYIALRDVRKARKAKNSRSTQ